MLAAFLALAALSALAIFALIGLLRSQQRAHARREDLLVNQLLHATGQTWSPPPAQTVARDRLAGEPESRTWTATPEQLPLAD